MKSFVLERPRALAVAEMVVPTPEAGQARVQVIACGVCGTDLHAYQGKQPFFSYPRRLGHELCVKVVAAPTESGLKPGTLCAVEPYFFCGTCPACRSGKTNCCQNLKVMGVHVDGGHAEELSIPWKHLHPGQGLSADQLAMVEPLAIGAHAIERARPGKGEPLAIFGLGPIGLAVACFAKAAGANVALVDLDENRLRFAAETMQLGTPLKGGEGLEMRLREHFGQLPSCIIDATGSPHSMNRSFLHAEHGGRVVFVGLFIGDLQFDDPNFHRRELTLLASRAALSHTFTDVIAAIRSGSVNPRPMITHRLAFADLEQEFPKLYQQTGLVKAVIDYPTK